MATSKFIIIRKDLDTDPSVLETEGITIGRLVSNDLTLNHPAVSRTHAGIKEIGADFWITNLSNANGTILNGSSIDSTPLAPGDVLQIGPFTIYVSFTDRALTLTVELSVNPQQSENAGATTVAPVDASGKTMMLSPAMLQQQNQKPGAGGTKRLSMTGKLTGLLGKPEEFALKVFWDKRKRDAGKMAETTVLKPNLNRGRVGKARFNWRSTSDLRRPWPVSLFFWGLVVVAVGSVVTAFAFKDSYSPGPLSSPHLRGERQQSDPKMMLAKDANANSCTACHSFTSSMKSKCAECHTTQSFKSTVSKEHEALGVTCAECHGEEHNGDRAQAAFGNHPFGAAAGDSSCSICHREGYVYKSVSTGKEVTLRTPHGGADIGYPVANGKWTWAGWSADKWKARNLPKTPNDWDAKSQFHMIHVINGRPEERVQCSDCHVAGFNGQALLTGVHESCANCHGAPKSDQVATAGAAQGQAAGSKCTSCHQQHTEGKDPVALMRARERNATRK